MHLENLILIFVDFILQPKTCGKNSNCEQLCVTTHDGKDACACRTGFVLHQNKHNWYVVILVLGLS